MDFIFLQYHTTSIFHLCPGMSRYHTHQHDKLWQDFGYILCMCNHHSHFLLLQHPSWCISDHYLRAFHLIHKVRMYHFIKLDHFLHRNLSHMTLSLVLLSSMEDMFLYKFHLYSDIPVCQCKDLGHKLYHWNLVIFHNHYISHTLHYQVIFLCQCIYLIRILAHLRKLLSSLGNLRKYQISIA